MTEKGGTCPEFFSMPKIYLTWLLTYSTCYGYETFHFYLSPYYGNRQ